MIEWDNKAFETALDGKIHDGRHIADAARLLGYDVTDITETSAKIHASINGEPVSITIEIPDEEVE